MSFVPRLSKPDRNDPFWITTAGGGYNKCIPINGTTSVLPNCVGYAYGRFMEILGAKECNLPTINAGLWFSQTSDGYARGSTPKLGAVGCWGKLGQAGHVGIVEVINPDGSIITSNSEYGGDYFETYNLKPPGYTWGNGFYLQGFIYLPTDIPNNNISAGIPKPISDLIDKAKSYIGNSKAQIQKAVKSTSTELSAKFVVMCINSISDLSGHIFPKSSISPSDDVGIAITKSMGTFISRQTTKGINKPSVGDLILLRKSTTKKYLNKYSCDSIGIISEVSDDAIKVIQYVDEKVQLKTYKTSNKLVQGYYRPNYSNVKSISESVTSFYESKNTDEDMMIREVAFLDSQYIPSTKYSGVRLAIINYTSYIGDLLSSVVVSDNEFGTSVIVDGISNNVAKQIIQFLIAKGLPASSACGVCGNIEAESGYKVGVTEYGYSEEAGGAGICQWTNDPRYNPNGRKSKMKKFVGSDWRTNLTGQLEFLWYELQRDYTKLLNLLQNYPNNSEGTKLAAESFLRMFEIPANVDAQVKYRQGLAMKLWNSLSVQITSNIQPQSTSIMSSKPFAGKEIEIPSWVNQDRMSANYTNYTYYFKTWGYIQRKIADKWDAQGRPSNRNIATLDGMYLMACTLIFGTTGDKISVILEDDTVINCLIADSKGDDPSKHGESGNIYGHAFGNGQINIVEWEKKGISSHWEDNTTVIDLTGWQGKKIKKIINGGAYIR